MGLLEPICAVGVCYNTRHVLVLLKTVSKINLSCATSLLDEAMLLFESKVFSWKIHYVESVSFILSAGLRPGCSF